jgi:hypothetical protein
MEDVAMASGNKWMLTGAITAGFVLLVVGGLLANGAGYFDGDSGSGADAAAESRDSGCCPVTGSDKSSSLEASPGCCPASGKGVSDALNAGCAGSDRGCEMATCSGEKAKAAGCEGSEECAGACESCESCGSADDCESCPTATE